MSQPSRSAEDKAFSVSPAGERFPLPRPDEHAAEYERIAALVKEQRELGREIVVVLETARPEGSGRSWDAAFEEAVREATGLVLKFLSRGERVGLLCGSLFVPPAMGPLHRTTVLTALALAEAGAEETPPLALPPGVALYRVRAA